MADQRSTGADVLPAHGCDGTLRFTLRWAGLTSDALRSLASRRLPIAGFRRWLEGNGGYCDCEAVMNVFDAGREGRPASDGGGQVFGRLRCVRSYLPARADDEEL